VVRIRPGKTEYTGSIIFSTPVQSILIDVNMSLFRVCKSIIGIVLPEINILNLTWRQLSSSKKGCRFILAAFRSWGPSHRSSRNLPPRPLSREGDKP
jgi:hypothetical protein